MDFENPVHKNTYFIIKSKLMKRQKTLGTLLGLEISHSTIFLRSQCHQRSIEGNSHKFPPEILFLFHVQELRSTWLCASNYWDTGAWKKPNQIKV